MSNPEQIEIVTIYNVSSTGRARTRVRLLSLLSLLVAAVWLYEVQSTIRFAWVPKIEDSSTVYDWLGLRILAAFLNAGAAGMDPAGAENPWVAAGWAPPPETGAGPSREERAAMAEAGQRQSVLLYIEKIAWVWIARLAGAWLALASLVGLTGRRTGLSMLRQASYLMLLSTVASVAAIYIAIRWGGMPPDADLPFYAKIAAVQSSYAWFLLITTRLFR